MVRGIMMVSGGTWKRNLTGRKGPIMGHNIGYAVVKDDKRAIRQFVDELCYTVEHDDWEEGGSYGGSTSLTNSARWHRGTVYPDRAAAEDAINKMDKGWYDDHAVLFRDVDSVKDTKAIETLRQRRADLMTKRTEYFKTNYPITRKSAYVTCPKCGSHVNKDYTHGFACPVCGKQDAFMSETVRKTITRYDERIKELDGKITDAKHKQAAKAPVVWLAKYEYHV